MTQTAVGERGRMGLPPKRDLISGVQLGLEKGELRIARHMKDVGSLVQELVDVRITAGLGLGKVRDGRRWERATRRSGDCAGTGLLESAA